METVLQALYNEPTRPRELCPGLPVELESVCLKCLEKAPTDRYPSAEALAALDPESLAMPRTRRTTFTTLVRQLADGTVHLGVERDWAETRAQLLALPGFGPWTVDVIAMRALGDPDAFLPTDLGIRRAAQELGLPSTPAALTARAAAWAPWRAYAVQYLWATDSHPINFLPV